MNPVKNAEWLVDTHCHLDFESFNLDRDAVLDNAASQGVVAIVIPGITLESSNAIVNSVDVTKGLYAAVGVHPNDAAGWNSDTESSLRSLALDSRVVAIGEIGLDYHWQKLPPLDQKRIFEVQLFIAADLDLPVIIHNREATEDIISVLLNWRSAIKSPTAYLEKPLGVLHSFTGTLHDALRITEMGFMIGIGGPITFRNARSLVEVVQELPLENIVVETDSPFLSPHPFRGKRNEPGRVRLVAERIAEIKGLSCHEVCSVTTENASRLFRGRVKVYHGKV